MKNNKNNENKVNFPLDKGGEGDFNKKPENIKSHNFAGFSQKIRNYVAAGLAFIGAAEMQAQQDPNHPDNTYYVTEQLDVWTANAAAQANFDTDAERANWVFREALVQYNAFHGGHRDLVHYVPHQHSTEIVSDAVIHESGNLASDRAHYTTAVENGTLSSLTGATHIIRVGSSNIAGNAAPNDLYDRRFVALNMDQATLRDKAHEFAHTFNDALHASHDNAMWDVPVDIYDLNGNFVGSTNRPTIGIPTAALQVEFYTANPANSIGNPTYGGDGCVL